MTPQINIRVAGKDPQGEEDEMAARRAASPSTSKADQQRAMREAKAGTTSLAEAHGVEIRTDPEALANAAQAELDGAYESPEARKGRADATKAQVAKLERQVRQGFMDTASALNQLHALDHWKAIGWDAYCKATFGFTAGRALQITKAAEITLQIEATGATTVAIPTTERQARAIAKEARDAEAIPTVSTAPQEGTPAASATLTDLAVDEGGIEALTTTAIIGNDGTLPPAVVPDDDLPPVTIAVVLTMLDDLTNWARVATKGDYAANPGIGRRMTIFADAMAELGWEDDR